MNKLGVGLDRADHFLDGVSDVEIMVLRGHLLLEEELYALLSARLPQARFVLEANFRFTQLVAIAKSLIFREEDRPVWLAIEALNSLRNKLAHRLEPKGYEPLVRQIDLLNPVPISEALHHEDTAVAINRGLGFMLAFLQLNRVPPEQK
jgi:hypothetical protein